MLQSANAILFVPSYRQAVMSRAWSLDCHHTTKPVKTSYLPKLHV